MEAHDILSFLSAVVINLNSLQGDFVFDDVHAIVNNKDVDETKTPLASLFYDNFWGSRMDSPVAEHQVMTYIIHLHLHCVTAMFVYRCFSSLCDPLTVLSSPHCADLSLEPHAPRHETLRIPCCQRGRPRHCHVCSPSDVARCTFR